jgi:hypothetical protein
VERHGQEGIARRVGLGVSVDVAIRVLESKSIGIGSGDENRSFVDGDVMGIALWLGEPQSGSIRSGS